MQKKSRVAFRRVHRLPFIDSHVRLESSWRNFFGGFGLWFPPCEEIRLITKDEADRLSRFSSRCFYNRWFYKRQSSVLRIDLSRFGGGQRDFQKLANLRVFLSRRNFRLQRVEDASATVAYAFRKTSPSLNIATQIQSLWEFARTTKGRNATYRVVGSIEL